MGKLKKELGALRPHRSKPRMQKAERILRAGTPTFRERFPSRDLTSVAQFSFLRV